jgi:hypothetical protein
METYLSLLLRTKQDEALRLSNRVTTTDILRRGPSQMHVEERTMKGFTTLRFAPFVLLAVGFMIPLSYGQVPQGEVLGTITDPSGAMIQDATVTLRDEQTGIMHSSVSDASGGYAFLYLDSGTYTVTVQKSGFATPVSGGISVQVEDKKRVDVKLKIGTTKVEVVHVAGSAAKIDTDSATIGSMISSQEVIGLPLTGREFSQLGLLSPGTVDEGTTGGALIISFATAVQVGGTSYGKNGYTIDGADSSFNVWNGPAMNPSVDSIQEFRMDRSQFSAEYGRGGAEMELATKSFGLLAHSGGGNGARRLLRRSHILHYGAS